jgi:virginiamycin B lyase
MRTAHGVSAAAGRWLPVAGVTGIVVVALTLPLPVLGQDSPTTADLVEVEITEWNVPWANTRPRDPFVDGEGRVWFVGQVGDYVAYLDPTSGEFTRFDLDPGSGPHNLIVDKDGMVWYAGNRAAHIGRLDPSTGDIDEYPMPDPAARDPHTLVFDSNGDIWFTVQGGNLVGHLSTATGDVQLVEVPTASARPYGIVVDEDDRPWVAEFGSYKIATVDPETYELTEYELPRKAARPRRLIVGGDGGVWYVDYAQGFLGRLDPATGRVTEWHVPGGARAGGYGMAVDDRDRIWFVESTIRPNRLVGFDPSTEEFFSLTEIPSGGGTVRHMYFHPPAKEIWFGTDTNNIGRARVP